MTAKKVGDIIDQHFSNGAVTSILGSDFIGKTRALHIELKARENVAKKADKGTKRKEDTDEAAEVMEAEMEVTTVVRGTNRKVESEPVDEYD